MADANDGAGSRGLAAALSTDELRRRLHDPALPSRIAALGFRDQDAADLREAVAVVRERNDDLDLMWRWTERLVGRIGHFGPAEAEPVWSGAPDRTDALASGVLPMLALLVTAPEVGAFHAGRGVPAEVSIATLADLGQQVRVHRLTSGKFGLHSHDWLLLTWSGALYRLGRLQFNLQFEQEDDERGEWVLSTHIPATGPLPPQSVDDSFSAATAFFATHFPDYPTRDFHCQSWLLDPALPLLLPSSQLAAFQRRWRLDGKRLPGDADVLFFVFHRREPVEVASLPTDTSLRRVVVERMAAGQSWSVVTGRLPQ